MPLLSQFNEHTKLSMLRNATWTLSNFCRGKPQPQFEQVGIKMLLGLVFVFVINLLVLVLLSKCYWNVFRQSLHYQLLHVLYIQMMKKWSLMHAGHYRIFLMVQMTKFKQLLRLLSVPVLLSFCCKYWFAFGPVWHMSSYCLLVILMFIFVSSHPSPSVLIPALRTIGNIVTGDDIQTQVVSI